MDKNPIRISTSSATPTRLPSRNSATRFLSHNSASLNRPKKCRTLVSLCLGVIGRHLEDILDELVEVSVIFPSEIKLALLGIARRRGLLCDTVILALADSSWELLDISGSDVTDMGMKNVVEICHRLKAVDISRCNRVTSLTICALLQKCKSLETLRCGSTPLSDLAARRSLDFLKPKLNEVEEDSWEELDGKDISNCTHALRWLIWLSIDEDSKDFLTVECPRIIVNPPDTARYRGMLVPKEALPGIVLDALFVEDIDSKTWAIHAALKPRTSRENTNSESSIIHKAELFRLAFVERDERVAPKRAKNMRQHQRRAERELLQYSTGAKSLFLASQLQKSQKR